MDITKLLNDLLAEVVPQINKTLPKAIKDAKLDPMKDVASEKKTFAKIDLGICKASAKGDYAIEDLKGLSSISITTMTVKNADVQNLSALTGTIKLSVKLSKKLSVKLSGGLTAECGIIHQRVGISGTATASGLSGSGEGDFKATYTLSSGKLCLTKFTIKSFSLSYTDIDVNVNKLGIFNVILNALVDAINKLFGKAIKGEISSQVKPLLAKQISNELPYCTKVQV